MLWLSRGLGCGSRVVGFGFRVLESMDGMAWKHSAAHTCFFVSNVKCARYFWV